MWPQPATVRWGHRRDATPAGKVTVSEHVFFPSKPMLTPPSRSGGFGVFMARARGDLPIYRRAGHLTLAAGLRLGAVQRVFTERLFVDVPAERAAEHGTGITEFVSDLLGRPVTTAVAIGSVRANRKPVLYVFDPKGHLLAYAKLAWNPLTAALNENEAAALEEVRAGDPKTFNVPRTIFHGQFNDALLLVLEPLAIPFSGKAMPIERLLPAMRELAALRGFEVTDLAAGTWWQDVRARLDSFPDSPTRQRLATVVDQVAGEFGGEVVTLGRWHGDWTRWNMSTRRGTLQLWDFERSVASAPLGFDAIHLLVHGVLEQAKLDPARVVALLESDHVRTTLAGLDDQQARSSVVVTAYLLEIALRASADLRVVGLTPSVRRAHWLIDVLEQQVR
jgi:hypothetical protein